jgi:hypothetical protein
MAGKHDPMEEIFRLLDDPDAPESQAFRETFKEYLESRPQGQQWLHETNQMATEHTRPSLFQRHKKRIQGAPSWVARFAMAAAAVCFVAAGWYGNLLYAHRPSAPTVIRAPGVAADIAPPGPNTSESDPSTVSDRPRHVGSWTGEWDGNDRNGQLQLNIAEGGSLYGMITNTARAYKLNLKNGRFREEGGKFQFDYTDLGTNYRVAGSLRFDDSSGRLTGKAIQYIQGDQSSSATIEMNLRKQ